MRSCGHKSSGFLKSSHRFGGCINVRKPYGAGSQPALKQNINPRASNREHLQDVKHHSEQAFGASAPIRNVHSEHAFGTRIWNTHSEHPRPFGT